MWILSILHIHLRDRLHEGYWTASFGKVLVDNLTYRTLECHFDICDTGSCGSRDCVACYIPMIDKMGTSVIVRDRENNF